MKRRLSLADPPFAGCTGAGVRVAVLDSGVRASHPHIGEGAVAESVAIDSAFGDSVDRLGHGTAVAAAIRDIAPGAQLIVGKIFERSLTTNAAVLADGIVWAADRGARLINLSLGTQNRAHEDNLRKSVAYAAERGGIVVSAREAAVAWLPGALEGVVAVAADRTLERDQLEVTEAGLIAAPYPRPIPGVPKERNLSGVSFAVANATGFLARLLEGDAAVRTSSHLKGILLQNGSQ